MPHPSTSSAYGIWSLNEVRDAERGDNWPSLPPYTFIFSGADEGNSSDYSITSPSGNERIALPNGTSDLCLFVADWTYQSEDANYAGGWDATIATANSNADINCGMAVFSNITYNQNTGKQTSSISMTGITVGSLLIYVANDNTAGTTIGAPSGFTTIYDHGTLTGGTTAQAHMSYKIADATSESFSVPSEQGALLEYLVSGSTSLIASATYGESGNPIVVTAPST